MPVIDNTNFLSVNNIKLSITRLPNVSFFVQKIILPGVSSRPTIQSNPFSPIKLQGDKGDFDTLKIIFIMDAEMNSYIELFNWWKDSVSPVNFNDYAKMQQEQKAHTKDGFYSDMTASILNSAGKAVTSITYTNTFPISISNVEMAYDLPDVNYPVMTAEFAYTSFDFN